MSNNWHRIEHDLNTRQQELIAEAKQYRLARQIRPAQMSFIFSLLRRVFVRRQPGSEAAQPLLNQQPAA